MKIDVQAQKKALAATLAVLVVLTGIYLYTTTGANTPGLEPETHGSEARWTVIFYFDGDNNLADYNQMLFNIECLEKVGSTDEVNMLVLLDRNEVGDSHAYYIKKGNLTEIQLSDINPQWTDEVNMGDPDTLVNWSDYCIDHYPAEHYNIMLSDHGGGWRGMCWDDNSNSDNLDLPELKDAFYRISSHAGKKIDIISTEACLVGMQEVAYELIDSADYYVAGETYGYGGENTTEGGIVVGNWQFTKVWGALAEKPEMTAKQFSDVMIDKFQFYGPWTSPPYIPKPQWSDCLTVFNLSKIANVTAAADDLASALTDKLSGAKGTLYREMVTKAIGTSELPPQYNTESFSGQLDFIGISVYTNYDLYDFAYQLSKTKLGITEQCQAVMDAVEGAVSNYVHGTDASQGQHVDAHGISIYIPYRQDEYNSDYEKTSFAEDTHWDEFIKAYWMI